VRRATPRVQCVTRVKRSPATGGSPNKNLGQRDSVPGYAASERPAGRRVRAAISARQPSPGVTAGDTQPTADVTAEIRSPPPASQRRHAGPSPGITAETRGTQRRHHGERHAGSSAGATARDKRYKALRRVRRDPDLWVAADG
jgi:hypothetical protein